MGKDSLAALDDIDRPDDRADVAGARYNRQKFKRLRFRMTATFEPRELLAP